MISRLRVRFQPSVPDGPVRPKSFSPRGVATRLFLTCWILFAMHTTTNIVREIYPAVAMGDHFSFRVDEYAGLHPDLFELQGHGWHINSNPGASMIGAIPYAIFRPVIDLVVNKVNRGRRARGETEPPAYNSPWPLARAFFQESWRRGFDIKLGLAAVVIQIFGMAPLSAWGVTAMFWFLRKATGSTQAALWLAILYAFGTPVFFRTGFLNQNLLAGHFAFLGFYALWGPAACFGWSARMRTLAAGVAGGLCVLLDYTGVVLLAALFFYSVGRRADELRRHHRLHHRLHQALWYIGGALLPLGLLFLYQWQSFGNPLLPAQYWMGAKAGSDIGYRGLGWPLPDQLLANLVDYRYGLFVSCPLLLLAFGAPWARTKWKTLEVPEKLLLVLVPVGVWLFSSSVAYSRLQFNTGVRYMTAGLPFLFIVAVPLLLRIPLRAAWCLGVISVAQSWSMAMYRDVEVGWGALDPLVKTLTNGFALPALAAVSRISSQGGNGLVSAVSPLPLYLLAAALLFGVWSTRFGGTKSGAL